MENFSWILEPVKKAKKTESKSAKKAAQKREENKSNPKNDRNYGDRNQLKIVPNNIKKHQLLAIFQKKRRGGVNAFLTAHLF